MYSYELWLSTGKNFNNINLFIDLKISDMDEWIDSDDDSSDSDAEKEKDNDSDSGAKKKKDQKKKGTCFILFIFFIIISLRRPTAWYRPSQW